MKIALDAKRAFHNNRGLGNYSRDTIRILKRFSTDELLLLNPSTRHNLPFDEARGLQVLTPRCQNAVSAALWRSYGCSADLRKQGVRLFHGLAQEMPLGLKGSGIRTVVTMHDLIFLRYPHLYPALYRQIFTQKNRYACQAADHLIAISGQTKQDLVDFLRADPEKITVVYQGCNPVFRQQATVEQLAEARVKYSLPDNYLLFVGAIEPRKNIATLLEGLRSCHYDLPLVVVGRETGYTPELLEKARQLGVSDRLLIRTSVMTADLPLLYQGASIFLYPAIFEGFGIPILEALCSHTPVITSTGSCFRETGGPDSLYVPYDDGEAMGEAIDRVLSDSSLRERMVRSGLVWAGRFTDEEIAKNLQQLYQKIV